MPTTQQQSDRCLSPDKQLTPSSITQTSKGGKAPLAVTQSLPLQKNKAATTTATTTTSRLTTTNSADAGGVEPAVLTNGTETTPRSSERLGGWYSSRKTTYRSVAFGTWKVGSARRLLSASKSDFILRDGENSIVVNDQPPNKKQHRINTHTANKKSQDTSEEVGASQKQTTPVNGVRTTVATNAGITPGAGDMSIMIPNGDGRNCMTARKVEKGKVVGPTGFISTRQPPNRLHQTTSEFAVYNPQGDCDSVTGDCFSSMDYMNFYHQTPAMVQQRCVSTIDADNNNQLLIAPVAAEEMSDDEELDEEDLQQVLNQFRQLRHYASMRECSSSVSMSPFAKKLRQGKARASATRLRLFGGGDTPPTPNNNTRGNNGRRSDDTSASASPAPVHGSAHIANGHVPNATVFGHRRSHSAGNALLFSTKTSPFATSSNDYRSRNSTDDTRRPLIANGSITDSESPPGRINPQRQKSSSSLSSYCANSLTATKRFLHKMYNHHHVPGCHKDVQNCNQSPFVNNSNSGQSALNGSERRSVRFCNGTALVRQQSEVATNCNCQECCVGGDYLLSTMVARPNHLSGNHRTADRSIRGSESADKLHNWDVVFNHLKMEFVNMRQRDMDILNNLQRVEQSLSGIRRLTTTPSSASPQQNGVYPMKNVSNGLINNSDAHGPSPIVELCPKLEKEFASPN